MLDFVVYVLFRAGSAIAAALPLRFLFAVGQFLGCCAWLVSRKYRHLAERNVAIAFGDEKSPRELHCLVRDHFRRLGANFLCSAKLTAMPPEEILRRVKVENIEAMARISRRRSRRARFESSGNMGVICAIDAEVCRVRAKCERLSEAWQPFH